MTQFGRRGRLLPQVADARRAVWRVVEESLGREPLPEDLVLVALSGGPDSLALAAATAHFARRGRLRVGAVVVDHQLQPGSGEVAARAAEQARGLGLDPVEIRAVQVDRGRDGPEAAARFARYAALAEVVERYRAHGVLLGHTRDDQAETVLLGLARGSGARSLSGMPPVSDRHGMRLLRPLLEVTRHETEAICTAEQLQPWFDPTNSDESLLRARVRHTVLPFLERELGPGLAGSLARTAAILGPDAELLDTQAQRVLEQAVEQARAEIRSGAALEPAAGALVMSLTVLREAPAPLTRRALARACVDMGGQPVSHERLEALTELIDGHGEAGPIQMAGKVSVYRRRPVRPRGRGVLELRLTQ